MILGGKCLANYFGINDYPKFVQAFRDLSGLDLNFYKENQMKRRINNFLSMQGFANNYPGFLQELDRNPELSDAFFKHLTINVTQFFRDAKFWDIYKENILPGLLRNKASLRIWSAGCSAGQEAYTMAIIMAEYFPRIQYSILGTDIDANVLKQARAGIYMERDFASTPRSILTKYFTQADKLYQIKESLKKNVSFSKHNLLTGLFERGFDLIACRNVVIYFTDRAKDLLYSKFSESLNPGGILFTGSTEHLFGKTNLGLKPVSSFFYQKQA